ncbi:DUF2182 domain-containing protein [Massilia sp.]|uniref:DUF2182 domain-containing protein n=1 Tax=Massilia sp. TaxID=1882437 RepID=UPI0028A20D90|nr:DUF2182 domain-containing protein [Massilia sp.]
MNVGEPDARAGSDRPVALALLLLSLLASVFWAALALVTPGGDAVLDAGAAAPSLPYRAARLALVFLMWAGLCTALMLPLASRAAVLFARLAGRRAQSARRRARLCTLLFVLAYLLAWTGFALLAMVVQWTLDAAAAAGTARHPAVLGLALAAAGIYQWTPAKHACLEHCRAPLPGILAGWRDGLAGAFGRGLAHAHQSLGCCWLLMLVLLAAGPDNPAAIAAIGLLVLAEIRLESGHWIACAGGLALLALGTRLLFP